MLLPIPAPELVLEAARLVMAEHRAASVAEAQRLLAEAEEWGAGVCCPEALIVYRERRAAAEADPGFARRALLRDAASMLREARRAIDAALAARHANTHGAAHGGAADVAATLLALHAALVLIDQTGDDETGDIADGHADAAWHHLDRHCAALHRLWAAHLVHHADPATRTSPAKTTSTAPPPVPAA